MTLRIFFFLLTLSLFAQKWQTHKKTGVKYKIIKDVKGDKAAYNDVVSIHFQFLNFKDSLLTTSEGRDPLSLQVEKTFKGSFEDGLTLMSEGDSMHFEVPSDSLGFPERPPFIPAGSPVYFRVKMVSIEKAAKPAKPVVKKINHKKFKKLPSGVEYQIIQDVAGQAVQTGGMVSLNLSYTNETETFEGLKQNRGEPIQLLIPDTLQKHTFMEALVLLSKGDSVLVKMSSDSLYKNVFNQPSPEGLAKGSTTLFEIRILNVLSRDSVAVLRAQYLAEKALEQEMRHTQYGKDTMMILDYLKRNNMIASKTPDGVYYSIRLSKAGKNLETGDTASTFYAGRLLDGTQFDSNFDAATNKYENPFDVVVGVTPVIQGWHSALKAMKRGEKATIFIPSVLGYGEDGAGERIPPNSVLIFDIEIKE